MNWNRWKDDGDTVWGIQRFPYPDGIRFRWEIRVVGADASAKPTLWGVWRDGAPCVGKFSLRLGCAPHLSFERVALAKAYVERTIVEETNDG